MSFDKILLSEKCLWCSIAAHALPSQNPYMKQITIFIVWTHKRSLWALTINCNNDNCWVWGPSMNWLVYGFAWLSAQGETCTVHT